MKTLRELSRTGRYMMVELVRHENIDCEHLTEDEFVELIQNDIKEACALYTEVREPELEEQRRKFVDGWKRRAEMDATAWWKTQRRRQEYVDMKVAEAKAKAQTIKDTEMYFDFYPEVGNSIPLVCILKQNTTADVLRLCFQHLKESRWFNKATGWSFQYMCYTDHLYKSCGRPVIELIMNQEDTDAREAEQKAFDDDVTRFYAGCTYCGD